MVIINQKHQIQGKKKDLEEFSIDCYDLKVKGFSVVNEAEVDAFLELSFFFDL